MGVFHFLCISHASDPAWRLVLSLNQIIRFSYFLIFGEEEKYVLFRKVANIFCLGLQLNEKLYNRFLSKSSHLLILFRENDHMIFWDSVSHGKILIGFWQRLKLCWFSFHQNTVDSLSAEGFTDIDLDTLRVVLGRCSLSATEIELFEAVVRWADHECRRQGLIEISHNKRKVCTFSSRWTL